MTKKQLYKAIKDVGFREYAIGLTPNSHQYNQFKVFFPRKVSKNTIVQLVNVENTQFIDNCFIFVPQQNITVLIKNGIDFLEDYFELHIPNYNKIWDSVNEC